MPVKPCLVCGRLSRGSHCPAHRVGWTARPSPSSRDRVQPPERARVKADAGDRCERCGTTGSPENPLQVHHRTRVADGGTHARGNLEVVCSDCHRAEHNPKGAA